MALVAGIDPGKKGGWAIYDWIDDRVIDAGRLWFDDPGAIYDKLKWCEEIIIERAQSAPGQGNGFEYGRGFGRAEAAALMTGADIYWCAASWWKAKLNVPTDKKLAIKKALERFPELSKFMATPNDDGVAEAALIATILGNQNLVEELKANNEKRARPKKKRVSFRL